MSLNVKDLYNYCVNSRLVNLLSENIEIKSWYFKCFAFFSFFCTLRWMINYLRHSRPINYMLSMFSRFPKLNTNNFCVVIGFGDSSSSFVVTEYLIELGYKVILLNNNRMISLRQSNREFQNLLSKHPGKIFTYTYKNVIDMDLKNIIKEFKIDYIFDTSIYRHFLENKEKELKNYELKFFHYDEISQKLNEYYLTIETFKYFIKETNFYLFNYVDKYDDLNYKFLYDLKIGFLVNFAEIYKDDFTMRFIKLTNENKMNPFNKQDLYQILRFSKNTNIKEHKLT